MKTCQKCQVEKRRVNFKPSQRYPDGLHPNCGECEYQIRLDTVARLPTALETRKLGELLAQPRVYTKPTETGEKVARKKEDAAFKRVMAERAEDAREAEDYVSRTRFRTRCGQCGRIGVDFYHPARDRGGKILVAGFTTMSEIDGRIEDMVPLCSICKPLIEKCKIKTHLFD